MHSVNFEHTQSIQSTAARPAATPRGVAEELEAIARVLRLEIKVRELRDAAQQALGQVPETPAVAALAPVLQALPALALQRPAPLGLKGEIAKSKLRHSLLAEDPRANSDDKEERTAAAKAVDAKLAKLGAAELDALIVEQAIFTESDYYAAFQAAWLAISYETVYGSTARQHVWGIGQLQSLWGFWNADRTQGGSNEVLRLREKYRYEGDEPSFAGLLLYLVHTFPGLTFADGAIHGLGTNRFAVNNFPMLQSAEYFEGARHATDCTLTTLSLKTLDLRGGIHDS